MVLILIENTIDGICSELDTFYQKFPESCRVIISKRSTLEQLDRFKQPPLLANGWLLICYDKLSATLLNKVKTLDKGPNVLIFYATSKKKAVIFKEMLQSHEIPYKVIDNLFPDKKKVLNFIQTELTVDSEKTAEYLYKRCNGYLPEIVKNVHTLSTLTVVGTQDVTKYTTKAVRGTLYDIGDYLLGINPELQYRDIVKIIHQYRHAAKHLLSYLEQYLEEYYRAFLYISRGELSAKNIREFKESTEDKVLKEIHDYRLLKIIESYKVVSLDKVIYIRSHVADIGHNNYSMYKLVYLCKALRCQEVI